MDVIISPAKRIFGKIMASPSKSIAHRIIILSCLIGNETVVYNIGNSKDVLTTISAMKSIGVNCKIENNKLFVYTFAKKKSAKIDCGECGTTLRFLLSVCSALGINAQLTGSKKLLSRPSDALIETLNKHGANIVDYKINGKIVAGDYEVDGSLSSQYISSLMIALSLLKEPSTITVTGKVVSENYIDLTIDCLRQFNVNVIKNKNIYTINPLAKSSPKESVIEGDYSSMANLMAMGAIKGSVEFYGLNKNSLQGDRYILDILNDFGANVKWEKDILTVSSGFLRGIELDCENIPDLVEIVAVIAVFAHGKTVLKNIERLRIKECDRLQALIEILTLAKVKFEYKENELIINGGTAFSNKFDSYNDHRTSMAIAVLCAFSNGDSKLNNAFVTEKSYPSFFEDYEKIGGNINGKI